MKIFLKNANKEIAQNAKWARHFFSRIKGLLGRKNFQSQDNLDGLLITPCQQIHSIGMQFEFDALYLDNTMRVVQIYENIKPNRLLPFNIAANSVLELPAGTAYLKGIKIGDVLIVEP